MPQSVGLRRAEADLEHRLATHRTLNRLLARGSAEGIRVFVVEISDFFTALGKQAGLRPETILVVAGAVVQDAFAPFLCYQRGHRREATRLLMIKWRFYRGDPVAVVSPRAHCRPGPADDGTLRMFSATVSGVLIAQAKASRGPALLAELLGALGMSHDEFGPVLEVSGETIRRWSHGTGSISEAKLAKLDSAAAALKRLVALFRPERLPEVIRRPAELFRGERAIDWIQRGRIADVADRYDLALSYQA